MTVDDRHDLGAFAAARWTDRSAPFFAEAKVMRDVISCACISSRRPRRPSAASARRHDQTWQTYASSLGESRIAGLRDLCCARFSRYAVPLPFLVSFECGG
jgi:hypothetical protein